MQRLRFAKKVLEIVASAVRLKGRLEARDRDRAICKAVYVKQRSSLESSLEFAIERFLNEQLQSAAALLAEAGDQKNCGTGAGGFQPGNTCWQGGATSLSFSGNETSRGDGVDGVSESWLGRALSDDEWSELAGAPTGSRVAVTVYINSLSGKPDKIGVSWTHEGLGAEGHRAIRRTYEGDLVMWVTGMELGENKSKGLGTQILHREILAAERLGIGTVRLLAEAPPKNGYYSWARLGFDRQLSSLDRLPAEWAGAKRVSDLMKTQEGRDWWKENIKQDQYLDFDVKSGSLSRRILDEYIKERFSRGQGGKSSRTGREGRKDSGSDMGFGVKDGGVVRRVFKPRAWRDRLIDLAAPILAEEMVRAILVQQKLMKIDIERIGKAVKNCGTGAGGFQPGNTCARGSDVTKTKAFKAWFGDWEDDPENSSKVVGDSGKPQKEYDIGVVYHGTEADFSEFDPGRAGDHGRAAGKGFYFAENVEIANQYAVMLGQGGNVKACYLNIRNPFDHDARFSVEDVNRLIEVAKENYPDFDKDELASELRQSVGRQSQQWGGSDENKRTVSGFGVYRGFALVLGDDTVNERVFKSAGYDGIVHRSYDLYGSPARKPDEKDEGRVWVAFEPTQIKSATGNSGEFDPTNPDITKSHKTTASDWIAKLETEEADELFHGWWSDLGLQIVTEQPVWMKTAVGQFLADAFDQPYWLKISETTRDDLEKFVADGIRAGQSIRTISQNIAGGLIQEGEDPTYAKVRAKNIARTEAGNALNGARSIAFDHLKEVLSDKPGLVKLIRRVWMSILSETTRDAHADLDGVPEDDDGKWDLNGVLCRWPSDVVLPASDRCQCYCTIVTEYGMDQEEVAQLLAEYAERVIEREKKYVESRARKVGVAI